MNRRFTSLMERRSLSCVSSAYLCRLMTLQSHADVEVAVAEAEAVLGGAEQTQLSFFCRFRHRKEKIIIFYSSLQSYLMTRDESGSSEGCPPARERRLHTY